MKTKLLLNRIFPKIYLSVVSTVLIFALSPEPCALSQVPQGFNYQAIARNSSGDPIINASLQVKLALTGDSLGTNIFWEELFNPVTTNAYGLFTVVLGRGTRQVTSTVPAFTSINWNVTPIFVRTQIYYQSSWKNMGSARLWSVPYALLAKRVGTLPYVNVTGETATMDSALFVVRNNTGQIIFAVYNEGVRIFVDDGKTKGTTKGGFAIGSFDRSKGTSQTLFVVDPDSIRAYIDTGLVKTTKGGFAIGSFDRSKSGSQQFLRVTQDSIRMYINDSPSKAVKGGFAIGGFDRSKGSSVQYLRVTHDSTRIITADTLKGFGVSNLNSGNILGYLRLTPSNYFIGHYAGNRITTGVYNSVVGYQSGYSLTGGLSNSFMGYKAGYANTTGNYNVFIGNLTGYSNNGSMNTFIGYISGKSNISGYYNSFFGDSTGYSNNSGYDNTFLGARAGFYNLKSYNTFVGAMAGYSNTNGPYNTATGSYALYSNTTGSWNCAFGSYSLLNNSTGGSNTAVGIRALCNNNIGVQNTSVGAWASNFSTKGNNNTSIGYNALFYDSTGNSNTAIGSFAGYNAKSASGNVFLGYRAGYNEAGSNKLYIANSFTDPPLIYGDFSTGTVSLGTITPSTSYKLYINGSAYATGTWTSSDIRWKKNINPLVGALIKILDLQPVNFDWRIDEYPSINFDSGKQIGLIAQDVGKIFPELVKTDENGYKAVSYEKLSVVLIEGIKEQQQIIEKQQAEIDHLKSLENDVAELKTLVNSLVANQAGQGNK